MVTTIGISLYSYLYLKLVKMLCFSYYLSCFLFNKIGEEGGTGSVQKWWGGGRQIMYIHVSKCKNNKILKKDGDDESTCKTCASNLKLRLLGTINWGLILEGLK
jgi:hypothetical protein